jgi:hypothetical protein
VEPGMNTVKTVSDREMQTRPSMRRTHGLRLIAALSIGLVAASFAPGSADAKDEEFVNGSGASYAQIYRVGPTAGRLSLAPIFGLSLADYLNTVGRGETKVVDWAGIGVAERSLPDNTPSLKVSSTQEGSEKGITEVVGGQSDGQTGGGFAEMYVRATDAPLGESRFRLNTLSIPGLIEARDSQSHSITGIVSEGLRQAVATTDIGSLSLAGGQVNLKGLHWRAAQTTGKKNTVTGTFTVEGATLGGVPLPMPGGPSDLVSILGPINAALAPTGFVMSVPRFEKRSGQAFVTPLSLDIADSQLGRTYLAPLLAELAFAREPVADAFIDLAKQLAEANESAPDLTVGVLAADLAIGIFSGSSQLHIEMGGVSAYTEGELFDNPFDDAFDLKPPTVAPTQTIAVPGTAGTPGTPGTPAGEEEEGELVAAPLPPGQRTVPGDKGGVAAIVGLIGLGVAIALATRDYWKMRQIRRDAVSA